MSDKKLTDKKEAFCEEYIVDLNATAAAVRAGYSPKTARSQGQRLLTNVDIQERITELKELRSEKTGLNAEWVVQSAKRVFDRCMQEEAIYDKSGDPVMVLTPDGEMAPAYKFDSNGANNALKIIYNHVEKESGADEAPSLNINFSVKEPVGEVKVTTGQDE